MNSHITALRFFFTSTLNRPDLSRKLVRVSCPRLADGAEPQQDGAFADAGYQTPSAVLAARRYCLRSVKTWLMFFRETITKRKLFLMNRITSSLWERTNSCKFGLLKVGLSAGRSSTPK